jgi:tetratricopeptide (TPR) repeat protein
VPPPSPGVPAQLFYSYSRKDEKLRDQLETHLSALKREKRISGWHDRRITAGTEWKGEIDEHLKNSSVILLLVTANFMASDYCHDVELRYAMEQHEQGKARVIPVILRPCDWKTTIFAKLQALPTDGKPVIDWKTRDNAFVNIVEGIRKALNEMGHGSSSSASEKAPATSAISVPILNALHQLPTPPADFTGRADELKELLATVKTGGVTISGLHGLGGVGKTALALKLAEQLKPNYPDAQFYLDLKGVTQPLTPRDAMAYVIRAYHPTAQMSEKDEEVAALYRSMLDGKRVLLLMDNARDAQQVAPLIPPVECLLLVTSRKHFTLPGLVEKNLDKLPARDARELLMCIAPRLKKEKMDHVDELAHLCGYLPLALRAVASALHEKKNISPADYANRLTEIGKHLVLHEVDPSLQKSVGATLQSSYDLFSDELRQRFRLLSVFPDTFDLAAAAAVCGIQPESAQKALGELLAYSLIDFDEVAIRYSLHDLVRLFVGQLLSSEERYSAQKRHAGYYLQVLAAADDLYLKGGESVTQGLALFDVECANIQAGHNWVVAHQQDDAVAELCVYYPGAGVCCLGLRQHPRDCISWLELALSTARRLKQRGWEGGALGNLGLAYKKLGEYRRSIEHHEQHLQITREIGDRRGEGQALGHLGIVYDCLGEYRRAIEHHEQDLKIAREIGDRRGEGTALGNVGLAYHSLGDYRRAIEHHEQHLQITREIGDRGGEGAALGSLGLAYHSLGEYHRAIEHHGQYLKIAHEIGAREGEGSALGNLGNAYNNLGEHRRAIEYHEQSLTLKREIGDRLGEGIALGSLGVVYYSLGEYNRAIEYHEQRLQIARQIGDRLGEGNALGNLGNAYDSLGEHQRAVEHYEQSLTIARQIGDRLGEATFLFNSALALEQLHDRPAAISRTEAELNIFETIESPHAARVRGQLAKWRAEDKDSSQGSAE